MYNFNLPKVARVEPIIGRLPAIVMARAVLSVGLAEAKALVDNNFPGHGDIAAQEFGVFLRAAVEHFKE